MYSTLIKIFNQDGLAIEKFISTELPFDTKKDFRAVLKEIDFRVRV